jgi:AraC-like DNA-binding protein
MRVQEYPDYMSTIRSHGMYDNEEAVPPLVRLSFFVPFVTYFDQRGLSIDAVLAEVGVTRDTVKQPDHFIHAETAYKLIDSAAKSAKDRFLGIHVGETLDFTQIALFFDAVKEARTLGEFFVHYLARIPGASSSVQHTLTLNGSAAEFETHRRIKSPKNSPAQSDGFGLSYIVRLFEAFALELWTPSQVTVSANHIEVVPPNYKGMRLEKDKAVTLKVRFPSAWLLRQLQLNSVLATKGSDGPKYEGDLQSVAGAIKVLVEDHKIASQVDADWIAGQLGISLRSLRNRLQKEGTTLMRELNASKMDIAKQALASGDGSVSAIAERLGYSATANFSRFFKTETGETPREYRNRKHS